MKKITIIAYINDDLKQGEYLYATDMDSHNENQDHQYFWQTKSGTYIKKDVMLGWDKDNVGQEIGLQQVLKGAREIVIKSEGVLDGSTVSFAIGTEETAEDYLKRPDQLAEILAIYIDYHVEEYRIVLDANCTAIDVEKKDASYIWKFSQVLHHLIAPMGRRCHFKIEGRAGKIIHDNNPAYYSAIVPMGYLYPSNLLENIEDKFKKSVFKIIDELVVSSYLFFKEKFAANVSIDSSIYENFADFLEKVIHVDFMIYLNIPKEDRDFILSENINKIIAQFLVGNIQVYQNMNYPLYPTIDFTTDRQKSGDIFEWGENNDIDLSGALGANDKIDMYIMNYSHRIADVLEKLPKSDLKSKYVENIISFNEAYIGKKTDIAADIMNNILETNFEKDTSKISIEDQKTIHRLSSGINFLVLQKKYAINRNIFNQSDLLNIYRSYNPSQSKEYPYNGICGALCDFFCLTHRFVEMEKNQNGQYVQYRVHELNNSERSILAITDIVNFFKYATSPQVEQTAKIKLMLSKIKGFIDAFIIDPYSHNKYTRKTRIFFSKLELPGHSTIVFDSDHNSNNIHSIKNLANNWMDHIEKLKPEFDVPYTVHIQSQDMSLENNNTSNEKQVDHGISFIKHKDNTYTYFDANTGISKNLNKLQMSHCIFETISLVSSHLYKDLSVIVKYEIKDIHYSRYVYHDPAFEHDYRDMAIYDRVQHIKEEIFHEFPDMFQDAVICRTLGEIRGSENWKLAQEEDVRIREEMAQYDASKKKVIIQINGDETSFKAAKDLFNKDPKNTEWIQARDSFGGSALKWSEAEQRFVIDNSLAIDRMTDLKITLVGHGRRHDGKLSFGGHDGEGINARLDGLIANKNLQGKLASLKVSLVGCSLAENGSMLEEDLPKTVAKWLKKSADELKIGYNNTELTAQKYAVRISPNGKKEILIEDNWFLAEERRALGEYTKLTLHIDKEGDIFKAKPSLDDLSKLSGEIAHSLLNEVDEDTKSNLNKLLEKIKEDIPKYNMEDSEIFNGMSKVKRALLYKAKIVKLAEQSNEIIQQYKPKEEGNWIADISNIEETEEGTKIRYINEKDGTFSEYYHVDNKTLLELKKHVHNVSDTLNEHFNLDENTGNLVHKPGTVSSTVENSNEILNAYFTIQSFIDLGKTSGSFNNLDTAAKIVFVSQFTQAGLGTVVSVSNILAKVKILNSVKTLSLVTKFGHFFTVIAPIFDAINLSKLISDLMFANKDEKDEIIVDLVLGVAGLITSTISIIALLIGIATASTALGVVGLVIGVLSLISTVVFMVINDAKIKAKHKKVIEENYGAFYNYVKSGYDVFIGKQSILDITGSVSYVMKKDEVKLVKFLPSLSIGKIDFKNKVCVIKDIYIDDISPENGNMLDIYNADEANIFNMEFNINIRRSVSRVSVYESLFSLPDSKLILISKLPDISDKDIVFLPGKASFVMHQEFGFSDYKVIPDQNLEHSEETQEDYPENEKELGKQLINQLSKNTEYKDNLKIYNKIRPQIKSPIDYDYNPDNSIYNIVELPITGFAVEYLNSNVEIVLDDKDRMFVVAPESVNDARFLNYFFYGATSKTTIVLSDRPVGMNIIGSKKRENTSDEAQEIWIFDLSKSVAGYKNNQVKSNISDISKGIVERFNVQIGDNKFLFTNTDLESVIFCAAFENKAMSSFVANLAAGNNQNIVLSCQSIILNEEYLDKIQDNNAKANEILSTLEFLQETFAHNLLPKDIFIISSYKNDPFLVHDNFSKAVLCIQKTKRAFVEVLDEIEKFQNIISKQNFTKFKLDMQGKDPATAEKNMENTYPDLYKLYLSYAFVRDILVIQDKSKHIIRFVGYLEVVSDTKDNKIRVLFKQKANMNDKINEFFSSINKNGELVPEILNIIINNTQDNFQFIVQDLLEYPVSLAKVVEGVWSKSNLFKNMSNFLIAVEDGFGRKTMANLSVREKLASEEFNFHNDLLIGNTGQIFRFRMHDGYILSEEKQIEGTKFYFLAKFNNNAAQIQYIPLELYICIDAIDPKSSEIYKLFMQSMQDNISSTSLQTLLLKLNFHKEDILNIGRQLKINLICDYQDQKSSHEVVFDIAANGMFLVVQDIVSYEEQKLDYQYGYKNTPPDHSVYIRDKNNDVNISQLDHIKDANCLIANSRKNTDKQLKITVDTEKNSNYLSLTILNEATGKILVDLLYITKQIYYSTFGMDLLIIRPGTFAVVIANAFVMQDKNSNVRIMLHYYNPPQDLEGDSFSILDIEKYFDYVDFDPIILSAKCKEVINNEIVFLDAANNEILLPIYS